MIDAPPVARAHRARPQTRPEHQRPQRSDPKHDERVAEEAVAEPLPPGAGDVLIEGQRQDVAGAAPVEIAGRAVMDGVGVAPVRERLEGEQPAQPADPEVGPPRGQKRAVGAVVEDDEGSHQEPGGRDREGEGGPVAELAEADVHEHRKRHVGHDRGREIEQAPAPGAGARTGPSSRARPAGSKRNRFWTGVRAVGRRRSLERHPLPVGPWRQRTPAPLERALARGDN